jgi:hypothetical protein
MLGAPEFDHRSLSSSERLIRIFSPVIEPTWHCHLWTPPEMQEFSDPRHCGFAVIYPACLRGVVDRWP